MFFNLQVHLWSVGNWFANSGDLYHKSYISLGITFKKSFICKYKCKLIYTYTCFNLYCETIKNITNKTSC